MKYCTKGNHEVPLENFTKNSRNKDGLFPWCKDCMKVYSRENLENGGRERKAVNTARYMLENKDLVWNFLLNSKCIDCNNNDPLVLEFDHIDSSTKLGNVTELMFRVGKNTLLAEINKCEIRCANCHRKKTNKQLGLWKFVRYSK